MKAASVVKSQILERSPHIPAELPEELGAQWTADFYSGPLGLALFWASMERAVGQGQGQDRYRSLQTLQPVRRWLEKRISGGRPAGGDGIALGGLCGLGAVIYGLSCIGQLLDEPDLLPEAMAAAELITPEQISRDRHFDLFFGSAGAILAILALEQMLATRADWEGTASRALLSRAECCARHLLENRSSHEDGPRSWPFSGGMYSGVPHGAAGIAYALLRLHERNGDPELLTAALEAIEFERTLFRPEHGNWILFAGSPEGQRLTASWCRGAPGIALARMAAFHIVRDPKIFEEIRAGLRTTQALPPTAEDDLCCGNLGRVEVLVHAGHAFTETDPDLHTRCLESADRLVYHVLRKAKSIGRFVWSKTLPDESFNPFFFQGAAGLGYSFLRLANPGLLPQPLLLAPWSQPCELMEVPSMPP